MRKGLTKEEVVSLAKVMEIKFSVSGPDIGGAKSGIDFDAKDPRRNKVLFRWHKTIYPLLKTYYGTDEAIFEDVSKSILNALVNIFHLDQSGKNISTNALEIA